MIFLPENQFKSKNIKANNNVTADDSEKSLILKRRNPLTNIFYTQFEISLSHLLPINEEVDRSGLFDRQGLLNSIIFNVKVVKLEGIEVFFRILALSKRL